MKVLLTYSSNSNYSYPWIWYAKKRPTKVIKSWEDPHSLGAYGDPSICLTGNGDCQRHHVSQIYNKRKVPTAVIYLLNFWGFVWQLSPFIFRSGQQLTLHVLRMACNILFHVHHTYPIHYMKENKKKGKMQR